MLPDQAMQAAFPLRRLQKLATGGINDLGAIKSESAELPQAARAEKTQQGNRAALAKTAPIPKAPKLNAPAPKPLEMSMPKIAALNKLQLLLTKQANLAQPVANSGLLPAAPNITTTTPIQRANNLHADKTNGNGVGGNMNPGSARVNSVIDDIGPLSTVGSINGNAGQGVRDGMGKLALQRLAAKIFK